MRNSRESSLKLGVCLAMLGVTGFSSFAHGHRGSTESSIRAAYVYNFAKLTTWPSSEDVTIGIIGSSETGDTIKRVVDGKSTGSHTITVKSISEGEAKSCQMVFVCGSGGVPSVGSAHCLTVGEGEGFCENGGAIGFEMSDGKVHFALNMKALKKAGLKVDEKLKAIGRVIE